MDEEDEEDDVLQIVIVKIRRLEDGVVAEEEWGSMGREGEWAAARMNDWMLMVDGVVHC